MAEDLAKATGSSTNKPPFFDETEYPYWKTHTQLFIESTNYRLWDIIENGNIVHKDDAGEPIKKDQLTEAQRKDYQLNARAKLFLLCALSKSQLDKVNGLATAKEVWEALGLAYEGTANVRQAKVSILVAEYETFKMKESESIDDMFGRFQTIVNGLRNLDRKYENVDQITKILRCLPRRWRPKVTAIQEAKDLSTLRLEDLLGSLKVHQIELAHDEGQKKEKNIAFKANSSKAVQTKEQSEEEESSEEMSDDEQALFNRKFKRMWIKQQKGKGGSNLDKSNITCFECKNPGHIKPDCPKLAKKSGKKPFYKKKKALAAGWDESVDGLEDEDEGEDDDALFALMASAESSEDEDDDEVKPENLKEEFNELLEHSYTLSEKYKALKKQFAKLQLEHEKVLIEKDHVLKENIALKEQDSVKEVTSLKKRIKVLIDDLSIFTIGHDNLVKLCGNNRELYDKSGLGFDSESTSSSECMSDISFISSEIDQNKFVVNCKIERAERKSSYEKNVPAKVTTNPSGPKKIWPGHVAVDCRAHKVEPTINAVKGKRPAAGGRVYIMDCEGIEGANG
ncbi:uncharacterized protein LOC130738000 [Lotus japonicus]|uniref:uncharacterized protein LOC130738000 n=1 Tax=Lotus japonicus TaxID=34305 RepID=UPI00258A6AD7|nr:uncharacterized protein LOC130738000 [Lotus japonicus]